MMTSNEMLAIYEQIEVLSAHMLDAARDSDWDRLILLEKNCSEEVAVLQQYEQTEDLSEAMREKKISLIKSILAHDKAIRAITEPWMEELNQLMKITHNQHQLSQSYGAQQL